MGRYAAAQAPMTPPAGGSPPPEPGPLTRRLLGRRVSQPTPTVSFELERRQANVEYGRGMAAEAWTRTIAMGAVLALALLAYAVRTPRADAAQFLHVTTTADGSDGGCTALKCTLRDAIEAPGEENVVEVPASATPYELTLGDLVLHRPLAIKGEGARRTVISGRANTEYSRSRRPAP